MTMIEHPTPSEMLAHTARALTTTVAPELTTDYARSQVGSAVGLLQYLAAHVDGAAQDLLDEHADLAGALGAAAPALARAGHDALASRALALAAEAAPDVRLSTLERRTAALQEALLDALLVAEPAVEAGDDALAPARDAVRAALARANARRLRA
jgi:hypothetical protein